MKKKDVAPTVKEPTKWEKRELEKKRAKRNKNKGTLSYSSKKIIRKRRSLLFGIGIADTVTFLAFFLIFVIYKLLEYADFIPKFDSTVNLVIFIGYFLIAIALVALVHLSKLRGANRNFKEFYFELLVEECQLEERTLFLNKEAISDAELKEIMQYLMLQDIWATKSYTITSNAASFDISSLFYNKHKNRGVIIRMQTEMRFPQILQIRNDGKAGPEAYHGDKVEKYGISNAEFDKDFSLYTSMKNDVYKNLGQQLVKQLMVFREFVKVPFVLTYSGNDLVIFADGWTIDLERELSDKEDIFYIDTQIEVLKLLEGHISNFAEIMGGRKL